MRAGTAESDDLAESAASSDESWKVDFEKSLWENYNVTPEYYEDLGDGVYQVYVKIDGKVVPYVAVDSATGDYHGWAKHNWGMPASGAGWSNSGRRLAAGTILFPLSWKPSWQWELFWL